MVRALSLLLFALSIILVTSHTSLASEAPITISMQVSGTHLLSLDSTGINLAQIVAKTASNPPIVTLVWTKQVSIFKQVWFLDLIAPSGSSVIGTLPDNGTSVQQIRLGITDSPQTGHQYESRLSYNPQTGDIAIFLFDKTDSMILYNDNMKISGTIQQLTAIPNGEVDGYAVSRVFVPADVEWQVSNDSNSDTGQLNRRSGIQLHATIPACSNEDKIELDAFSGDAKVTIARLNCSQGHTQAVIEPTSLPIGPVIMELYYSSQGDRWSMGQKTFVVNDGQLNISFGEFTQVGQTLIGDVTLQADTSMANLAMTITADVTGLRGDDEHLLQTKVTAFSGQVDISQKPAILSIHIPLSTYHYPMYRLDFTPEVVMETINVHTSGQQTYAASMESLLDLTSNQVTRLKQSNGLLELAPVVLPQGKNLVGNNWHFGWPIATMIDDTIVLTYQRSARHFAGTRQGDAYSSGSMMIRSSDGGTTWSSPVDLRDVIVNRTQGVRAGMRAIGSTPDGAVVYISSDGVFRSNDKGHTWQYLSGAFGKEQLFGPKTNIGPNIIEHPTYGLMVLGHTEAGSNANGTPSIADEIWVRYSKDGGSTWQEGRINTPSYAKAVEPTGLYWQNALFILARSHADESYDAKNQTWRYVQLWSESGMAPLKAALTNIRASDTQSWTGSKFQGPWCQDTVDLAYNPVTQRMEAVVTNRCGGGPGKEDQQSVMTLNLWSISPTGFSEGRSDWRFEGTLLERHGVVSRGVPQDLAADGMHPAGAVIDKARGVQHIFIYSGYPEGPSGIFRLTRTLDTDNLSQWLKNQ